MRQEFSFYYAAIPDSNKKAECSLSVGSEIKLFHLAAPSRGLENFRCGIWMQCFFVTFVFRVWVLFFLHRFLFAVCLCIWLCCVYLQRVC